MGADTHCRLVVFGSSNLLLKACASPLGGENVKGGVVVLEVVVFSNIYFIFGVSAVTMTNGQPLRYGLFQLRDTSRSKTACHIVNRRLHICHMLMYLGIRVVRLVRKLWLLRCSSSPDSYSSC